MTDATSPDEYMADPRARALRAAFSKALEFKPLSQDSRVLSEGDIQSAAEQEASYGRVSINESGLTPGSRRLLLQPAREFLSGWGRLKGEFNAAIQPYMEDIRAFDEFDVGISELRARRDSVKQHIEQRAASDPDYSKAVKHYEECKQTYNDLRDREGRRAPTLAAYSPFYWVAMFCIGVSEWLINYDVFLIFMGIPAVAAGTTIILGVLLAFAAHGHGMLLRQWSARFGQQNSRADRNSEWRLFALATFSLLLVIGAAAGSRYAAAMHVLGTQQTPNILGDEVMIQVSPMRDVGLTLLANVAAWAVGVFFAYFTHDKNPAYMSAAHVFAKAEKKYLRHRRRFGDELATEEAKIEKEINERERVAGSRFGSVKEQREMLFQIEKHGAELSKLIADGVRRGAESYRDALAQLGLQKSDAVQLYVSDKLISPFEYQEMQIKIDDLLAEN